MHRILAYPYRLLVIESTWSEIRAGEWRGQTKPASVEGSIYSWCARGVPIWLAGTREEAEKVAARYLFCVARHRFEEIRGLVDNLKIAE